MFHKLKFNNDQLLLVLGLVLVLDRASASASVGLGSELKLDQETWLVPDPTEFSP